MNNTVIIAHPSTDSTRGIGAQVSAISDKLVILETSSIENMELLCKEYGCALLIIDAGLFPAGSTLAVLPQDAAILILLEADQVEHYLADTTVLAENCTLLTYPTLDSLFRHHVRRLLKQRTTIQDLFLARERINTLSKELASSNKSLQAQQRYLDILSERDGLTGLYNRRHLTAILRQEFQRGKRYNTDLSLLLFDIDNFKQINHRHGHLFGDFILNEIAARLTSNTRDSDLCFRFGGGNFIILLPQSTITHGHNAAKKLNLCCSAKAFDNGQNTQQVTISIGIASLWGSMPDSPDQFINMADRAMYLAKARGKDRCQAYQVESTKKSL